MGITAHLVIDNASVCVPYYFTPALSSALATPSSSPSRSPPPATDEQTLRANNSPNGNRHLLPTGGFAFVTAACARGARCHDGVGVQRTARPIEIRPRRGLREGILWSRRLSPSSKISNHRSVDRKQQYKRSTTIRSVCLARLTSTDSMSTRWRCAIRPWGTWTR